ncbi:FAD:protein FMN transferase [Massilia sp. TWR1-2-2]|uniref:FAD:protein FMN transferase n=1 Tax=Massilia sp. TWR1-2-2 TaxID=2804584 RepID=UPI003CEC5EFA
MMRRAQPWLGTLVDITLGPDADPQAATAAFAGVALVHRLMSFHDAASDVSRFNRAAVGALIEVDPRTWEVLRLAGQVAASSGGCFNVACAPRLVEWCYLPAPAEPAPAYVPGKRTYELEAGERVRKTSAAWIDLGGIAKGYAVDLAIAALEQHRVGSACVNAGGDLRVIGDTDWPIAIRAPHDPTVTGARLLLRNAALATSANYFAARGQVSPLVDGRDGQPRTDRRSVTVRAPSCALADALTKVVMASGDAYHPCIAGFGASAFII